MWVGIQINNEHNGTVSVTCPFKVSGYWLDNTSGQPITNTEVKARIGSKFETGYTDAEGRFDLAFKSVESGGPYPLILNNDVFQKLSAIIEDEFSWGESPKTNDKFVEVIERKKAFFENAQIQQTQMVAANQILVFFGTKGGVGTSAIATVVARELYAQGIPVMVIEAARSGGSLVRMFSNIPVRYGLDTMSNISPDEIGEAKIAPLLVEVRKGLEILPISSGGNLKGENHWTIPSARELYRWASRRMGYVVVDAGSDLTFPLANAAFWMANKIFPIVCPDPIGTDSAVRFSEIARGSSWSRVIPGWITRGDSGDLEELTGIKSSFILKNSSDWEQVAHGKITGGTKKAVKKIIEASQVVLGGNLA